MEFGNLPKNYKDGECPFDALKEGEYFFILGFSGCCPNCETIKVPYKIWVIYQRDERNWHVFKPMEDLRCGGCGAKVGNIVVMCGNKPLNVTGEFTDIVA